MEEKKECQFCNHQSKNVPLINNRYWYVEIENWEFSEKATLEIECSPEFSNYESTEINFCPMCGRELKKEIE